MLVMLALRPVGVAIHWPRSDLRADAHDAGFHARLDAMTFICWQSWNSLMLMTACLESLAELAFS